MDNNLMYYFIIPNIVIFWVCVIWLIYTFDKKIKLEEYKINLDCTLDGSAPNLLNEIIGDAYDEYMALNENFKKGFIDTQGEEKILKGVKDLVAKRMSKPILIKLTSYYNEEALYDVIASKIYILVVGTVMDNNSIKDDVDEL